MHASEIVPDVVILLVGHPWTRHEDKEDYVHDLKHDD